MMTEPKLTGFDVKLPSLMWACAALKINRAFEIQNLVNTKTGKAIAIIYLSVLGYSCSAEPSPIKIGTDRFYAGNIMLGKKFQVAIGDPRSVARIILEHQRIEYYGEDHCDVRFSRMVECKIGDKYDVYRKNGILQSGFIYVFIRYEKVEAIAWSFNYAVDM